MHSFRWRLTAGACCVVAIFVAATGCGSKNTPTYRVSGKVVFTDGEPMPGGTIMLRPVDSDYRVISRGTIQPDGTFQLSTFRTNDGAIEGKNCVMVSPPMPEQKLGQPLVRVPQVIQPKYRSFDTSGLTCIVTRDPSQNQFTFQVERAP